MTSLLWHSLLALGAGVLLNFTPCVLPVIPFKVQAVLRDIGQSRRQRWGAATAMLAGSLLFFAVLGGATLLLGLSWGALFQSKAFVTGLTLFLLVAGLLTLFNWTAPLPQWVYKVEGQRYTGAALTGMLTGVLATPCGGPFLGAVLAYALTQPPLIGLMIFLSIGTGLVLPYLLLLVWPWLSNRSFKTGVWADQVKQLLGFVLLGGAVFFSRSLVGPELGRVFWLVLAVLLLVWVGIKLGQHRLWRERIVPLLAGTACVALMAVRLLGAPAVELDWRPFTTEALAAAQSAQQPVMVEFTAEWCLNCKVLEETTYADPQVLETAKQTEVLPLRVDMTEMAPSDNQLLFSYGGRALPFLVLLDGKGQVSQTFTGLFGATTLTDALDKLVEPAS